MYVNSWQTINMAQSLCASAFEGSHGRRLHVFTHKLFKEQLLHRNTITIDVQYNNY